MKYKLKSDEAEVYVLQEGAMLTSLKKDDTEYLWQGDEEHWSGQAPICFPIVGVLKNNEGTAFGKKCNMKRHGVARISPFELKEKYENSITFIQKSSSETRAAYPFDYELEVSYTLLKSSVSVEYKIKNTSNEKMPFSIGGHPAFNCPLCEGESFEDYKVIFDRPTEQKVLRPNHETGLIDRTKRYDAACGKDYIDMRHELFEENDAMIFDDIKSKRATLLGPSGKGVRLEYQDMKNLLIWSACGKANFVALEPWSATAAFTDESEKLEEKKDITILEPNSVAVFGYKITLI